MALPLREGKGIFPGAGIFQDVQLHLCLGLLNGALYVKACEKVQSAKIRRKPKWLKPMDLGEGVDCCTLPMTAIGLWAPVPCLKWKGAISLWAPCV